MLTPQTLQEYLDAYRIRTEWLSEKFPNSARAFQYFEWSFMISMVEKITRLGIENCQSQLSYMTHVLHQNKTDFVACPEIQEFEKVWIAQYIQ